MPKIYLLPTENNHVNYSKYRQELERFVEKNEVCKRILEIEVTQDVYQQLGICSFI